MWVSVLGFGAHEMMDSRIEEVQRLLHAALEMGINVIDTAECYGESEELIGQAIAERRSEYYLFTKCGHAAGLDLPDWHPRMLEQSIERSLKRLRTDYLDLVQLHRCPRKLLQRGEVIEVLQRARDAGKTRYIGYSGDREHALTAVQMGVFDTLQLSVNIADQEAIERILPQARARQMGIFTKRSLANMGWKPEQHSIDPTRQAYQKRLSTLNYDFLQREFDEVLSIALRFPLSVPGVDMALVGTTNPDHIEKNIALVAAGALPQEQYETIRVRWKQATWWRRGLPGSRVGWHARI
ncbi:MAG: aldo/keto reductase [Chloroflexi bacterium]|nr:aldo/keto reductase [Chloroflexota bacterium]